MNITGKIHFIGEEQQISATLVKRELVLVYAENPQYPQYIAFETIKDRVRLLDNFKPGDEVSVEFNLRGREWTNPKGEKKYFNSLELWRINPVMAHQQSNAASAPQSVNTSPSFSEPAMPEDDLPF